jgi:hypothetical protein
MARHAQSIPKRIAVGAALAYAAIMVACSGTAATPQMPERPVSTPARYHVTIPLHGGERAYTVPADRISSLRPLGEGLRFTFSAGVSLRERELATAEEQRIYDRLKEANPPIDQVTALHLEDIVSSYTLPQRQAAEELIDSVKLTLDHLGVYLSGSLTMPDINFVIPQTYEEIEAAQRVREGTLFNIYAVANLENTAVFTGFLRSSEQQGAFAITASIDFPGAEILGLYQIEPTAEGYRVMQEQGRMALWNISAPYSRIMESPGAEVLHVLLQPYTQQHIQDDLNEKPPASTDELIQRVHAWTLNEEFAVHALHLEWIQQANRDLGLGLDMLTLQRGSWWQHPGVQQTRGIVQALGLSSAIEAYRNNPALLFPDAI